MNIQLNWRASDRYFFMLIALLTSLSISAQTWTDSLDNFSRNKFMPANKYRWTWQDASLLRTMAVQYEQSPEAEKTIYLDYIQKAMDKTIGRANGKRPNAVASGHGMAFLYKVTGNKKYLAAAEKIFRDYLKSPRTKGGGVSHLRNSPELWDDTIYMIGVYLMEMYRATGDEKYLDELIQQVRIHREKLRDEEWGLWRHGWDGNNKNHCALCGQRDWPDKISRKSAEIWGRGNGWIIVTLSDLLQTIPSNSPNHTELAGYLKEMILQLPELQDKSTGHWFQLPVRTGQPGNYIESSCTAMFAFGILQALKMGIIEGDNYENSVEMAYKGLRNYSIKPIESPYLSIENVCKGTCIGDMDYYLNRKADAVKPSGLAMFILFGRTYELFQETK